MIILVSVILLVIISHIVIMKPSKSKNEYGGVTYAVNRAFQNYVYECGATPVAQIIKQFPKNLVPLFEDIKIWYYVIDFDLNNELKKGRFYFRTTQSTEECAEQYEEYFVRYMQKDKTVKENKFVPQLTCYQYIYEDSTYRYYLNISRESDEKKTMIEMKILHKRDVKEI